MAGNRQIESGLLHIMLTALNSLQAFRTAMAMLVLLSGAAGAGIVATDLVWISDRFAPDNIWYRAHCDLLPALLIVKGVNLLNRARQTIGHGLVLVKRKIFRF